MPRFDQQGPDGQGAMTGRKMGKCTNYGRGRKFEETPLNSENIEPQMPLQGGYRRGMQRGVGRGMGRGRGFGRGDERGFGRRGGF